MQNNILQYLFCFISLCFIGCDTTHTIHSQKYISDFSLASTQTFLLDDTQLFSKKAIIDAFKDEGLIINDHSFLHVRIESSFDTSESCMLKASLPQESFLRLSLYGDAEQEYYRIQYNGYKRIAIDDLKKLIKRMKRELVD